MTKINEDLLNLTYDICHIYEVSNNDENCAFVLDIIDQCTVQLIEEHSEFDQSTKFELFVEFDNGERLLLIHINNKQYDKHITYTVGLKSVDGVLQHV